MSDNATDKIITEDADLMAEELLSDTASTPNPLPKKDTPAIKMYSAPSRSLPAGVSVKGDSDTGENVEVLGEVISWDFESNDLHVDVVADSFADEGFLVQIPEVKITSAMSRSSQELKEGHSMVIRKMKSQQDDYLRYQFTYEVEDDENEQIDYSAKALVKVNKETGEVTCEGDQDLANRAEREIEFHQNHRKPSDVSRCVKAAMEVGADLFPLNPRKGVAYFVPVDHEDVVDRMSRCIERMGGFMHRFPVPKSHERSRASVKEAVKEGITGMLRDLEAIASKWTDSTTEKTTEKAMDEWRTVSSKVEAYSIYLADQQEALEAKLGESKGVIMNKILELKSARESKRCGCGTCDDCIDSQAKAESRARD